MSIRLCSGTFLELRSQFDSYPEFLKAQFVKIMDGCAIAFVAFLSVCALTRY